MDDLLDDYVQERQPEQLLLELVDEYSMYCHYLGFEPELGTKYRSPLRMGDDNPSFSIYTQTKLKGPFEFAWKDHGLSKHGDIFTLVGLLFGLKYKRDIYRKVDKDFNLGLYEPSDNIPTEKVILVDPPDKRIPIKIRLKSIPFTAQALQFWKQYGITEGTLKLYNVTQVTHIWFYEHQIYPVSPTGLCFAYRIGKHYKLYQPYNPEYKFRNDYLSHYTEGFLQLNYNQDTLIITKSTKDVMVLRELGYEAVSPRSESTPIPEAHRTYFETRYKRIVLLFDNDMKHNGHLYPYEQIYIPLSSGTKDISDFVKKFGTSEGRKLITSLLQ